MICLTTSVGALRLNLWSACILLFTYKDTGNLLNQSLVDLHLEHIPSLGTLTVRCLTGGDLEVLGRKANGSLDAKVLALGTINKLGADLLKGLAVARSEGDADLVDFLLSETVRKLRC